MFKHGGNGFGSTVSPLVLQYLAYVIATLEATGLTSENCMESSVWPVNLWGEGGGSNLQSFIIKMAPHCRKSWRNISFPSDFSELFHEDITTNISEKCSS
jgi:hypothetical protein